MPRKSTKPPAPRYYIRFNTQDDLSGNSGWRLYDRMVFDDRGGDLPIALCRNVYCARIIRNTLNSKPDVSPNQSPEIPHRESAALPWMVPIEPWHEDSYGPHTLIFIRYLAEEVRFKHGTRMARDIIQSHGKAGYLREVYRENYPALISALQAQL